MEAELVGDDVDLNDEAVEDEASKNKFDVVDADNLVCVMMSE